MSDNPLLSIPADEMYRSYIPVPDKSATPNEFETPNKTKLRPDERPNTQNYWFLINVVYISMIVFSLIMYLYSYDIFKYILMFIVAILITHYLAYYYTGNPFPFNISTYSETTMWFFVIIFILLLMSISAYEIRNYQPKEISVPTVDY